MKFDDDIHVIGKPVRLTPAAFKRMESLRIPGFHREATGVVVAGIGLVKPPPGGCYVKWPYLREPTPQFGEDLVEVISV